MLDQEPRGSLLASGKYFSWSDDKVLSQSLLSILGKYCGACDTGKDPTTDTDEKIHQAESYWTLIRFSVCLCVCVCVFSPEL